MEEEPAASHDFLDRLRRVSFILFLSSRMKSHLDTR